MKYRSKLNIINQIAETLLKGDAKKTKIKYQAFLTSRQIRYYLPLMMWMEQIQFDKATKLYKITEKGVRYQTFQRELGIIT